MKIIVYAGGTGVLNINIQPDDIKKLSSGNVLDKAKNLISDK